MLALSMQGEPEQVALGIESGPLAWPDELPPPPLPPPPLQPESRAVNPIERIIFVFICSFHFNEVDLYCFL